jgi:uncharacterized membrane protein
MALKELPMPNLLMAYVFALVVFGFIDLVWISLVVEPMYRQALGDMLEPTIRLAPAIAFYLMFPAGLAIFAVAPALKSGSLWTAMAYGALFGFFTYATYDLTNFAVLKNWTLQITVSDIVYGAAMGALVSAGSFWGVRFFDK